MSVQAERSRSTQRGFRTLLGSSFPFFACLYAALFGAFGTESPFFPSFLASRGLAPAEIGMALAAGTVVRLTSGSLVGMGADLFGTRRVLAIAAASAGTIILIFLIAAGFWPLLLVCMLHALAVTPLNPLADALAVPASAREGVFSYGSIRGVGSASFVVGTLASGFLIAHFGLDSIILSAAILFLLMLPPISFLPKTETAGSRIVKGAITILLSIRPYRRMLLIAGLVIGSHAMSDTFAVIHWRASGIAPAAISSLLAEAVVSEIAIFFFLGPILLRRVGPARCLAIAAVAGIVRWGVFATTANVGMLALTEPLHGLTFALLHLACMQIIAATVPEYLSATAQSVYGTLFLGIASATITLASGSLYQRLGAQAFWSMSFLCAAALPFIFGLSSAIDADQSIQHKSGSKRVEGH